MDVEPVLLIKKKYTNIIDEDQNTQLHAAAAKANQQGVLEELSKGENVDAENYLGWTPLMMAVKHGHMEIVKVLLENRADATRKNKFKMSVFIIAITRGSIKLTELLLKHLLCGGVSKQKMQEVISPISIAILFSNFRIVRYLVKQSFDLNASTYSTDITPLMFAAAMSYFQIYDFLIAKGANVAIKNYLGQTAANIIEYKHAREICVQQQKTPLIYVRSPNEYPTEENKKSNTITPNYCQQKMQPPQLPVVFVGSPYECPTEDNRKSNAITPNYCQQNVQSSQLPVVYVGSPHECPTEDNRKSNAITPNYCQQNMQPSQLPLVYVGSPHEYPTEDNRKFSNAITPNYCQQNMQPSQLPVLYVGSPQEYPTEDNRKSSTGITPNYCITPSMTPLGMVPQMFFPPNFTPSHCMAGQYFSPCDFVNANVRPNHFYLTPTL